MANITRKQLSDGPGLHFTLGAYTHGGRPEPEVWAVYAAVGGEPDQPRLKQEHPNQLITSLS